MVELAQAREYFNSKAFELRQLRIAAVYYTFQHRLWGEFDGQSELCIQVFSDAPTQQLRRATRRILADAPCRVCTEMLDAAKKPNVSYDGSFVLFEHRTDEPFNLSGQE